MTQKKPLSKLQKEVLLLFAEDSARGMSHYDDKAYSWRTEIHIPERQIIRTKRPTIMTLRRHGLIEGSSLAGPWTITERGRAIAAHIRNGEDFQL